MSRSRSRRIALCALAVFVAGTALSLGGAWHASSLQRIEVFAGAAEDLAFSPDGALIAVAGVTTGARPSASVRLIDASRGALGREIALTTPTLDEEGASTWDPPCVRFTPDGALLVAGYGPSVGVFSVAGGAPVTSIQCDHVRAIAVAPSGRELGVATSGGFVELWSLPGAEPLGTVRVPKPVKSISYSPSRPQIAVGCKEGDVHVFWRAGSPRTGLLIGVGRKQGYVRVAFSPDGDFLAAANPWGDTLTLNRGTDGEAVWTVEAREPYEPAFSRDGELLAVSLEHDFEIRSARTGALVASAHLGQRARFSSNGALAWLEGGAVVICPPGWLAWRRNLNRP